MKLSELQRTSKELARKTRKGHYQLILTEWDTPQIIKHLEALPRDAPCPYVIRIYPRFGVLASDADPAFTDWDKDLRTAFINRFGDLVSDLDWALAFSSCPWRIKWWSLDIPKWKGPAWLIGFRHADIMQELAHCLHKPTRGILGEHPQHSRQHVYAVRFPRGQPVKYASTGRRRRYNIANPEFTKFGTR